MPLLLTAAPKLKPVDLRRRYDAIVVGSGAAGGMAAHVLTSHGLEVLLLEAGRKLDLEAELRSMEWPYDHPRRGAMPHTSHALTFNEYTIRQPPYAAGASWKSVHSYVQGWGGSDYSKNIVVDEKDHPYTGTNYAWVRARCLGGKTNIWGRLALRLSDYDFKAKSHDGYGEDWPISYADLAPYYDKVDFYLGIAGHPEGLPHLPDSRFQRTTRLNHAEVLLRQSLARSERVLTPYRAGVTTDGLKHNKYRSRCYGRGACNRRAGGCDIHAAFDSPTGLIYPALDTGRLTLRTESVAREVTVDPATGKARGVAFVDAVTGEALEARGKVVVLAASTLESTRLMLLSRSPRHPNGIGNSSGHVGHNFCEHVMGPGVGGFVKDLVGKPRTLDDGRPGSFYIPRFRNLKDRHPDFIRGYGFEGGSGAEMFPDSAEAPGFGRAYKKAVREMAGATIGMGGFGEVLPRYENAVDLDPEVKDKWGIPVLRFGFKFGENEKRMCADMADAAREMFEEAGIEVVSVRRRILTEGWSIHELGTARMGSDPRTSVLNQFEQSHDVRNLFVVDGSSFVSASCQNPTWTIMALCWRSCDYLADQLRKGEL
ncbi:MAG TPA: GMC family oxidoreductase [Vicinamibacteria bacterium]|nr:GMC family oxidoreductase [Vicinamibacteria bacterium]